MKVLLLPALIWMVFPAAKRLKMLQQKNRRKDPFNDIRVSRTEP
ncbi:hypothetical protein RABR111495_19520 [Rahnella bruchi]